MDIYLTKIHINESRKKIILKSYEEIMLIKKKEVLFQFIVIH